jgi:methyltransferase (TIGR00027 family)
MPAGADRTAVGPMVIVAVEQFEPSPLVHDPWAAKLLPLSGRLAVSLAKWPPARRSTLKATEKKLPGLWASMLCRKRYIDDRLHDAVQDGIEAVVILGAGFDTRAYRVPGVAGIPVWELDLPANTARKEAALRRCFGRVPDGVTLVPIDFETQDLHEELTRHGYQPGARTFVAWEAVTQYLTEAGVRRTLGHLAHTGPDSRLAFTYLRRDFLDGVATYGADAAYQDFVVKRRLWRFGMDPEQVADLLAEYGWTEHEQLGPQEFTDRYLEPAGRRLPVSEIERSVHALRDGS